MIYHNGSNDLDGLDDDASAACKVLWPHRDRFDSIAVSGISGITVGMLVARAMDRPLVIVRKAHSHSGSRPVNSKYVGKRVLFLDDFISMGDTRDRVRDAVESEGAQVIGTLEYAHIDFPTDYDSGDDGLNWL